MNSTAWLNSQLLALALALTVTATAHTARSAEALGTSPGELKYEAPAYLQGTIYSTAPNNPRVLFKFTRKATRSGSTLQVQRDFTYPDGRIAARERVVYEGNTLASYALEELQTGASGSARVQRSLESPAQARLEFTYTAEPGAHAKTRTEGLADNTLIADMVGPFLLSHWEALTHGEKVRCRYIVVPRKETVGFTFVKDSDATWHGHNVVIIRMEPTSKLVAALVSPLFFTMEQAAPHRVLQYTGRTTPKVPVGNKWKDLDAVTVFDWDSAR